MWPQPHLRSAAFRAAGLVVAVNYSEDEEDEEKEREEEAMAKEAGEEIAESLIVRLREEAESRRPRIQGAWSSLSS